MKAVYLDHQKGDDFEATQYYITSPLRTKTCISNIIEIYQEPSDNGTIIEVWLLNQKLERVHQYKMDDYREAIDHKRAEKFKAHQMQKDGQGPEITDHDILFIIGASKIYIYKSKNVIDIAK